MARLDSPRPIYCPATGSLLQREAERELGAFKCAGRGLARWPSTAAAARPQW